MTNWLFSYRTALALTLNFLPLLAISQSDFWESTNLTTGDIRLIAKKQDGTLFAGHDGLFRSVDDGKTWDAIPSLPNEYVISMFIKDNGEIFAGTDDGIYRSSNNGDNWSPVGLQGQQILAIVSHPNGSLIVGTGPSNAGAMYMSTDGGATWVNIQGLSKAMKRIGGIAYQLTVDGNGQLFLGTYLAGCWISKDGGNRWSKLPIPRFNGASISYNADGDLLASGDYLGGRVYRSRNLGRIWKRVDAKLIQSGVTSSLDINGTIFSSTWGSGVYQGMNHGTTWSQVNSGLPYMNVPAIALTKDGFLLVGTSGGGIFRSRTTVLGISSPHTAQQAENNPPLTFSLGHNYPNPFNPSTTIEFSISEPEFVTLSISNLSGEDVVTMVSDELDAGVYTIEWDASNRPSGVYFCRLIAGSHADTKKLIVVK